MHQSSCYDADVVNDYSSHQQSNIQTWSYNVVLLVEHPAVHDTVIDVNDSTVMCDYNRYAAGDDDVNVAGNTSHRRD